MEKKDNKKGLYIVIVLLVAVIILLVLLLFGKNTLTKNKSISVTSKTVDEQSDLKTAIDKVYNAVVYIEVEGKEQTIFGTEEKTAASGSGFVYKTDDNSGYIITNNHVVSGSNKVTVTYIDGSETKAEVIGSDEFSDIAILKVDKKTVLSLVELGNSSSQSVGDTVFTVGAPLGKLYMGTITKGILSGKNRMVEVNLSSGSYLMETLQTDATINSGNSGGPLCNILGQVIGVTSSKLIGDGVEGMGFAIPIDSVNSILTRLENGQKVERPYLGVQIADLSSVNRNQSNYAFKKDLNSGAVLTYVEPGKAADRAGLKIGDVIVKIDDEKIDSASKFRYALYKHTVGDSMKIEYYRGNDSKSVTIKLTDKVE